MFVVESSLAWNIKSVWSTTLSFSSLRYKACIGPILANLGHVYCEWNMVGLTIHGKDSNDEFLSWVVWYHWHEIKILMARGGLYHCLSLSSVMLVLSFSHYPKDYRVNSHLGLHLYSRVSKLEILWVHVTHTLTSCNKRLTLWQIKICFQILKYLKNICYK